MLRLISILTFLMGLAWASSASAQLVAYGDMPGTPGPLENQPTGTLLGNWDPQDSQEFSLRAPGLSYPLLQTSGSAAFGGGAYTSAGFGLTIPNSWEANNDWVPWREQTGSGAMVGAEGTTLWSSMLVNSLIDAPDFNIAFHDSNIRWGEGDSAVELINSNGFWALKQKNGPTVVSSIKVDPGRTDLIVMKYDFIDDTSDRVTLYVNPTPGVAAPNVTGTVLDTTSDFNFRSLRFYPDKDRLTGEIDEVRFGGTYNDVTPYDANATGTSFDRQRAYFIGNSVTDSINQNAMRQSALDAESIIPWGRQVIPGTPLDYLIANPTSGFQAAPYGGYATALPNYTWDFVSLQPFDRPVESDRDSIDTLIDLAQTNPANDQTRFAIYQRWPRKESDGTLNYQASWDGLDPDTRVEERRQFFTDLLLDVRADQTDVGKEIVLVPVGDVLYELDKRLAANPVAGVDTVVDFYSDGIHINEPAGQYLLGATYYSVMFQKAPTDFSPDAYESGGQIDPALLSLIRDTVWDVVSVHPYAGIAAPEISGDFDHDGDVDGNDFLVWQRGGSPHGIDSEDLGNWQVNYAVPGNGEVNSAIAVPEPTAIGPYTILILMFALGKRPPPPFLTPLIS